MSPGIRHRLLGLLPDSLYLLLRRGVYLRRLLADHLYDFRRNVRWSSAIDRGDSPPKLAALISMLEHGVEKGLALRDSRPGFGRDKIDLLLDRLERYTSYYGEDEIVRHAVTALDEYCQQAEQSEIDVADVRQRISRLPIPLDAAPSSSTAGTREMRRDDVLEAARHDLRAFFSSRSSVRTFSDRNVDDSLIAAAVTMAQKTPSVCNRQSSRVLVITEPQRITQALSIQGGARGFADQINKLLVITSDISHFQSSGERNQGWIDGGMFAVSVIYALHSLGLGTCALNWSKGRHDDRLLREALDIADSESVIMLIAVGHLPERLRVAASPQKPLGDVLTFA